MSVELDEPGILQTSLGHVGRCGMRPWRIHGIAHWWRVRHNGLVLAGRTGADRRVVRIFALAHDAFREEDGADPNHGPRAAHWLELVRSDDVPAADPACAAVRAADATLDDAAFESRCEACHRHASARGHDDPMGATCFAADRLDLWRVGIMPNPHRMPIGPEILDERALRDAVDRTERGLAWIDRADFASAWGIAMPELPGRLPRSPDPSTRGAIHRPRAQPLGTPHP